MYMLMLMLCTVGTPAVDLWQPLVLFQQSLVGIDVVYSLVLMLCTVGTDAMDWWQPFALLVDNLLLGLMLCTCWC